MLFQERKQAVICVVTLLLMSGFVVLRYLPLRKRIKIVKQTKAAELLAVSKGQTQSRQLPVLRQQSHDLAEAIGDYEARIPQQRQLGLFLREITDLMNENNLREQVIEPGEQTKTEKLNCIPVKMQCKGNLAELFQFFKRLQKLDRLIRIEQVKLTNDTGFTGEATMETMAVIYYGARLTEG